MSGFNFEELYLLALRNADKPKNQLNCVHVCIHGAGSTNAFVNCRHFGTDPDDTVFRKVEKMES